MGHRRRAGRRRGVTSAELRARLRLMVLTSSKPDALRVIEAALRGGATAVQLRDKDATCRERTRRGRALRRLTQDFGALLIVNDRVDVAHAVDADGVHVGPDDVPVAAIRTHVDDDFLIGRSADEPAVAERAVADGADYIGCGAVFPTTTKDVGSEAIGRSGIQRVADRVDVPVIAIGGITRDGAVSLAGAGACGVAVSSAVMDAVDPEAASRKLRSAVDTWYGRYGSG